MVIGVINQLGYQCKLIIGWFITMKLHHYGIIGTLIYIYIYIPTYWSYKPTGSKKTCRYTNGTAQILLCHLGGNGHTALALHRPLVGVPLPMETLRAKCQVGELENPVR